MNSAYLEYMRKGTTIEIVKGEFLSCHFGRCKGLASFRIDNELYCFKHCCDVMTQNLSDICAASSRENMKSDRRNGIGL
jgi:hypothetical protein